MKETDANHACELYAQIRDIDRNIERARSAHTIRVEALVNGNAETHRVSLELAAHALAVRDILICELRALRKLRGEGLTRLGFVVPEAPL